MKLIDEKGRLFGKINVIDFLVVLFLLCLMPMFYFGYKIMTKKPMVEAPQKREFVEIIIDCRFIKLKPEVLDAILVGDKELDENGQVIGQIVSLGESKPYMLEFSIGKGQKMVIEDVILKQIEAKVKLKVEVKKDKLYYKDKVIKIASPLDFKTNKYSLSVVVALHKEVEEVEEKWLSLQLKFSEVRPEVAAAIQEGDIEKDFSDKTLAGIQSIRSNIPSQVLSLRENEIITLGHPFNRDILVSLNVLCMKKEGVYYFKNYPVKLGNNIVFCTDSYSILGVIVGMEKE